jgi:hypothetical protein
VIFSRKFWAGAVERAVKTAAQFTVFAIGASQGFDLFTLDWKRLVGFAAGGAFLSLLTSLGSEPFGPSGSASVVD